MMTTLENRLHRNELHSDVPVTQRAMFQKILNDRGIQERLNATEDNVVREAEISRLYDIVQRHYDTDKSNIDGKMGYARKTYLAAQAAGTAINVATAGAATLPAWMTEFFAVAPSEVAITAKRRYQMYSSQQEGGYLSSLWSALKTAADMVPYAALRAVGAVTTPLGGAGVYISHLASKWLGNIRTARMQTEYNAKAEFLGQDPVKIESIPYEYTPRSDIIKESSTSAEYIPGRRITPKQDYQRRESIFSQDREGRLESATNREERRRPDPSKSRDRTSSNI